MTQVSKKFLYLTLTRSFEPHSARNLASPADILRRASRGEGTRDARLRMSAGEATRNYYLLHLFYLIYFLVFII